FRSFGSTYDIGAQCWTPDYQGTDGRSLNAMHGTATASIAGGIKFGVAKGATIVDARAVQCSGNPDVWHVTKAIDWICTRDTRRVAGLSVINLSLEFLYSQTNPDFQAMD